jgi:hypothetical protein
MGDPISSYATAGIALRVSGALKPHHHDKVETPSVGTSTSTSTTTTTNINNVAYLLKARTVEPENSRYEILHASNDKGIMTKRDVKRTAVVMEQLSIHVSAEANTRNNRRAVFSVRFVPRGYKKGQRRSFLS